MTEITYELAYEAYSQITWGRPPESYDEHCEAEEYALSEIS